MANWFRLWHELPTDPKWRTVARVSKQRIGDVIAVYLHILVDASANATERGRTQSFNSEDVASALDLDTEAVDAICSAMQGRVLDGDVVRGWAKRQPEREDGSAERARQWRESRKQAKDGETNAERTQANASERKANAEERPDVDVDTEKEKEEAKAEARALAPKEPAPATKSRKPRSELAIATRLPLDWRPSDADLAFAAQSRPDVDALMEADVFRDHWHSAPEAKARKTDWSATWRNWIRRAHGRPNQRGSPAGRPSVAEVFAGKNYTGTSDADLPDWARN